MANATDATSFDSATRELRHFYNWWSGELAAFVPLRLRPAARFLSDAAFVAIEGKRVQVNCWREGRIERLDDLDLGPLPQAEQPLALRAWLSRALAPGAAPALLLQPGDALSHQIEMPRAAEESLRQAIAFELNRYTPFKANEVYFDCRVLKRMSGERGLTVQFAVAPKTRVDASLSLLAQAGEV